MTQEQELRESRQALNSAINAGDVESAIAHIHQSYVGKGKGGYSIDYQSMVQLLSSLPKGFESQLLIEDIEISGDSAKVTVRRSEAAPVNPVVMYWRGLGVGGGVGVTAMNATWRLAREPFELWPAVFASLTCVVLVWLAIFLRPRGTQTEVRAEEGWKTIDGRWMLVEEKEF